MTDLQMLSAGLNYKERLRQKRIERGIEIASKDIFTKIKSSLHTKANCGEYPGALDPYGYLRNTQDK